VTLRERPRVTVNLAVVFTVVVPMTTESVPVVAPGGTAVDMVVADRAAHVVATMPLKVTVHGLAKFVPVRVTAVPTPPLVGVNDVTETTVALHTF
jgi:hypothetical protein